MMSQLPRSCLAGLAGALIGCAATTAPTPPPEERLVVLDAADNSLLLVPVDPEILVRRIQLDPGLAGVADVAARGQTAVVVAAESGLVVIVDLRSEVVRRTVALAVGSGPAAVLMLSETVAYVANAGLNSVTRVDLTTGDTASVSVGQYPRDLVLTRGRLFVVNGNVGSCPLGLCSLGPSWLTVVDPQSNARAAGGDSIPLPTQGNARSATVSGDGLVYVVNTGDVDAALPGRLSIVDPISRQEVGSFGGLGFLPASVASDGAERLFITSVTDGLMEFNIRSRRVVRGAGQGIFVKDNVAVAVDSRGAIYAIEGGACVPGQTGRLRIFRPDLTESRSLTLGSCPVTGVMTQLPGLAADPS